MMTNPAKNVKNADFVFLRIGRGGGKVFAIKNFIDQKKKENPNIKFVIIRAKDLYERKNKK